MGWMQTFLHVDKGKSLGESTDRNMTVILSSLNLQRLNYFILLILFLIIEINWKWQDKIRALQGLWLKCLAIRLALISSGELHEPDLAKFSSHFCIAL